MNGQLPTDWFISSRLMCAWRFSDGSTLEVGAGDYVLTDAAGTVIMEGADHRVPMARSWADVCASLVGFLLAYGEGCDHDDECEIPHDWCADHAFELEALSLELEVAGV